MKHFFRLITPVTSLAQHCAVLIVLKIVSGYAMDLSVIIIYYNNNFSETNPTKDRDFVELLTSTLTKEMAYRQSKGEFLWYMICRRHGNPLIHRWQ